MSKQGESKSIISKETIKILGEVAGVGNLKDEIAIALASDVEYRIREIIQEAAKFMRHGKRQKLTTDDMNYALKVRNIEPLYGFRSKEPVTFKKIPGIGPDLYYIQDEEIDCTEFLRSPLPKLPLDVTYTHHWLAIDGVQPAIPQNPPPQDTKEREKEKEKEDENERSITEITVEAPTGYSEGDENVQVKPLVKHVLSKELQLYYEKIIESVLKKEPEIRKAALNSLRSDAGIHQLVPYFCQFVADKITKNLKNLEILWAMLYIIDALVQNPHLFMEPYLHQLMPSILTCLVGRNLCANPKKDDHWALRDFAARILRYICSRYGSAYTTLEPRIAKTLLRAFLDPLKPQTTHYGAIVGLDALGREVVRVLLIPNIKAYGQLLQPQLSPENKNELKKLEAQKCYFAILSVVGKFLKEEAKLILPKTNSKKRKSTTNEEKVTLTFENFPTTKEELEEIFGIFGDHLTPYVENPQAMSMSL